MPPYYPSVPSSLPSQLSNLSGDIAWMIFGLLLVLFGVFTAILRYHWKHFDFTHSPGVVRAQIIYYAGSLLFIAGMIISLLSL